MGFLDKVKATAEKAADKAQQGVHQGQQKIEELQDKRKAEAMLRDLGAAHFFEKTGRGTPAITSDIERLVAAIRELEDSGVEIEPAKTGSDAGPGDPSPTPPSSS